MFKIKCKKKNGLNSESRDVSSITKRIFLCQEVKYSDQYKNSDILFSQIENKEIDISVINNQDVNNPN